METSRFSLIEIDGLDSKPQVAAPAMTTPVQGEPTAPARLDSLDQEGRARAVLVDEVLREHGLAFSEPTFFAWGTRGSWLDKAKRARAELHAMPLHRELAEEARRVVSAEGRRGDVVDFSSVAYGQDDRLRTRQGSHGARCTPQALKQLLARADAPGGAYLCDPRIDGLLREPHVNHWLGVRRGVEAATRRANADANRKAPAPQQTKLLSKLDGLGGRCVYGVVGPRYPHDYGMDRVIADVQGMFPGEARGTLHYDAATTRWRVDAAVGAEFEPVVGDVYRLGVRYGAHDAGGGSYFADLYGIRVRCVNFTKIKGLKRLGRVRHVGSVDELQARVKELVGAGAEAMEGYAEAVREANESAIVERSLNHGDARLVFHALVEGGYAPAPGGDRDAAVEAYHNAWLVEPGHTRLDFVNAITRAAHEAPWSSPWVTEEIEDAAGELLYNRLVLTDKQLENA